MGGNGAGKGVVRIEARPEAVDIDPARTALVIVDMQNVFAGRGDSMRQSGQDTSGIIRAIERTRKLAEAARANAIGVIYVVMVKEPERKGKGLIKTANDRKIVDELTPLPGDRIIEKSAYSGFRGTSLDEVLKKEGIEHLIFAGTATNVCVESTLRDAYFLDYRPILAEDATSNAGPSFTQAATLWNVEEAFGWVATTENILKALSEE